MSKMKIKIKKKKKLNKLINFSFMTKVDQMVKVQCFYMESDKTVTVPLEVRLDKEILIKMIIDANK